MTDRGRPRLRASAVSRAYGSDLAVDAVDLDVRRGEVHAIVGLNGAGKTTLMRLMLGMVAPDVGVAYVDGVDVRVAEASVWRRVGHLIETPFAYPELTVRENLAAAALLHGMRRPDVAKAVEHSIERFELGRWADRPARVLSLGNRQRLGLASAMGHRPGILVLDEPANSLDPAGVILVRDVIRDAVSDGAAALVSSHHLDQLARMADRITVMHRGRVVGTIDPGESDLEERFFEIVYSADAADREPVS